MLYEHYKGPVTILSPVFAEEVTALMKRYNFDLVTETLAEIIGVPKENILSVFILVKVLVKKKPISNYVCFFRILQLKTHFLKKSATIF